MDLEVFKLAYDVSLKIHTLCLQFPKAEQFALSSQMRRASKGICTNILEGFAKQPHSKAEFKRFLVIAIGSANEMVLWLKYCKDLNYIEASNADRLSNQYGQIAAMLQNLHQRSSEQVPA